MLVPKVKLAKKKEGRKRRRKNGERTRTRTQKNVPKLSEKLAKVRF